MEQDINNLIEELTNVRPNELSAEGLKLFNKINEIIDRNKELEEKWNKDTHKLQNALDMANADKINNYIPVSLIEEKLEKEKLPNIIVGGRRNAKTLEYGKKLGRIEMCEELLEKRK